MCLDLERRVTFVLPLSCLLILIFLLPTPLKVPPPRLAILSWKHFNVSTPGAILKPTLLNSWYSNRLQKRKGHQENWSVNVNVSPDSPEMRWKKCPSLAEFSSLARWSQVFTRRNQLINSIISPPSETSIPCKYYFQNIDMAAWEKVGKKVRIDKGLSTYYVSQFWGFSDPPSPPRPQSSAFGLSPSPPSGG